MTVVVGTAGHIDHGKTALLRALTGIDADRLPEERRRGMTIDVGYAHMTLSSGEELDFVDVPGHDRLVGNMLVGAGEIDAAMLVIAADEGPQAQTLEHLALLNALGIDDGLAILTKLDLLDPTDPRRRGREDEVRALLAPTRLARIPIVAVSATSGEGLDALRGELAALQGRVAARPTHRGSRLAVDRAFSVKGRGLVVTGSLRGGAIATGQSLRLEPGSRSVRVREAQVHGTAVDRTPVSGRVALNLAGIDANEIRRGMALVVGASVRGTTRLLVVLEPTDGQRRLDDGAEVRLHLGTAGTLARVRLARRAPADDGPTPGRGTAVDSASDDSSVAALILAEPIPAALDDRFVLRWPSPTDIIGGGRVIDPYPPGRLVRHRLDIQALAALAQAGSPADRFAALVRTHRVLAQADGAAAAAALGDDPATLAASTTDIRTIRGRWFDSSVVTAGEGAATSTVEASPGSAPLSGVRQAVERAMRHAAPGAGITREDATAVVAELVAKGDLERDGETLRSPGAQPARSAQLETAMERLEAALDVPQPPSLGEAAWTAGCPPEGVRGLVAEGRIVRLESDLAYASTMFARLEATAVDLARRGPLTPAAFRDASGTSRKYALAVLEELDGRGVLRRAPEGHVLGPKAPPVS